MELLSETQQLQVQPGVCLQQSTPTTGTNDLLLVCADACAGSISDC